MIHTRGHATQRSCLEISISYHQLLDQAFVNKKCIYRARQRLPAANGDMSGLAISITGTIFT